MLLTALQVAFIFLGVDATARRDIWHLLVKYKAEWIKKIPQVLEYYMGVSKNRVFYPPNHPILIGFFIIFTIHFWGTIIFGNTHIISKDDKDISV